MTTMTTTTSWNTLPLEVWTIIFSHLGSAKQLAKYRLVCKAWDPLIERAMFSQPLTLIDERRIVRILNVLQQKPSICRHIRSLDMTCCSYLPIRLQRTLFNRIQRFKNLKELRLTTTRVRYLTDVDSIIGKYPRLKSLTLALQGVILPQANEDDFLTWMLGNVQPSVSVGDITVNCTTPDASLIEYLLFKYPNISSAYFGYVEDGRFGAMQRILNHLQAISNVEIDKWWVKNDADLVVAVLSALKSLENFVAIRRSTNRLISGQDLAMGAHRIQTRDYTRFYLFVSEEAVPQILALVNQTLGSLGNLDIDYRDNTNLSNLPGTQDTSTFDRFFNTISVARRTRLFGTHIPRFQLPAGNVVMSTSLHELELCGCIINGRVFSVLDQVAPNLKYLNLISCILNIQRTQNYHIKMPSSDLASLSIIIERSFRDTICGTYDVFKLKIADLKLRSLWLHNNMIGTENKQMVSLLVSTMSSTQYFALKPETPTALRAISEQDYLKFSADERPSIVIECRSLGDLELNLGALKLDLKIDAERPIESIEDWI